MTYVWIVIGFVVLVILYKKRRNIKAIFSKRCAGCIAFRRFFKAEPSALQMCSFYRIPGFVLMEGVGELQDD